MINVNNSEISCLTIKIHQKMNSLKFVSYKLREQIMDINYIYNLFVHQLNRVRDLSKLIKIFILSVSAAKFNNGWGGWACLSVKFVFLKIPQSLECYVTADGLLLCQSHTLCY